MQYVALVNKINHKSINIKGILWGFIVNKKNDVDIHTPEHLACILNNLTNMLSAFSSL